MSDHDRKMWTDVLAHLRRQHPTLWRQWFDQLEPLGLDGGILRVGAHTAVQSDYLQRVCLDAFKDALQAASGRLLAVRFCGPDDRAHPDQAAAHAPPTPAYRSDGLTINPDYGFENFIPGPGNQVAFAASTAVAETPGRMYNPLFIHGGSGLGKTHLLQAICLRILADRPRALLYYTSCEAFSNQYFEAIQAGQMTAFRRKFREVDALVIDDIHFLSQRDRSQEEFFHTFNTLHQAGKQIVLSSDAAPERIPELEERLVSRFNSGMVAEVEPPCYETRLAIIRKKASLRGLQIPDDAAEFIAARIDTNIRELEGAISRVQLQSWVAGEPITLELARKALGERAPKSAIGPTVPIITQVVADFFGVRVGDLLSKKRAKSVTLPRHVCMYLARQLTRHSLEEIGGFFGGRDHTTAIHAIRSVTRKRQEDSEFDRLVASLDDQLHAQSP